YASTQTIFVALMADHYYLERNEYVKWPPASFFEVVVPGQHQTALAMTWSGTAHPVWHKRNPRVANVTALAGVLNRQDTCECCHIRDTGIALMPYRVRRAAPRHC